MRFWRGPLVNIRCSLRESRLSLICNRHGCSHCAAAKTTYLLRRRSRRRFVELPLSVVGCLSQQERHGSGQCHNSLILGGVGLRSAVRTSESAHWASWADCLPMMRERHPEVAREFVTRLEPGVETQCLGAAATTARNLAGTHGFEPPSWTALALGARPPPRSQMITNLESRDWGGNTKPLHGWSCNSESCS